MIHRMEIYEKNMMEKILTGQKKVDIRLYRQREELLLPNDNIIYSCPKCDEEIKAAVSIDSLHIYSTGIALECFETYKPHEFGLSKSITQPYTAFKKLINRHYLTREILRSSIIVICFTLENDLEGIIDKYNVEKHYGSTRSVIDTRGI